MLFVGHETPLTGGMNSIVAGVWRPVNAFGVMCENVRTRRRAGWTRIALQRPI